MPYITEEDEIEGELIRKISSKVRKKKKCPETFTAYKKTIKISE